MACVLYVSGHPALLLALHPVTDVRPYACSEIGTTSKTGDPHAQKYPQHFNINLLDERFSLRVLECRWPTFLCSRSHVSRQAASAVLPQQQHGRKAINVLKCCFLSGPCAVLVRRQVFSTVANHIRGLRLEPPTLDGVLIKSSEVIHLRFRRWCSSSRYH